MTIKEAPPPESHDLVNDFAAMMYGMKPNVKKISAVVAVTDQFDRTTFAHLLSDGDKMTLAISEPPMLPGNPSKAHTRLMNAFVDMAKIFGESKTGNVDMMRYDIQESDRESFKSKKID